MFSRRQRAGFIGLSRRASRPTLLGLVKGRETRSARLHGAAYALAKARMRSPLKRAQRDLHGQPPGVMKCARPRCGLLSR